MWHLLFHQEAKVYYSCILVKFGEVSGKECDDSEAKAETKERERKKKKGKLSKQVWTGSLDNECALTI